MIKNYFDITMALAGVCQSARLVQQLAYKTQCDEQSLHVSLQSLLDLNPPSVSAVYGDKPPIYIWDWKHCKPYLMHHHEKGMVPS